MKEKIKKEGKENKNPGGCVGPLGGEFGNFWPMKLSATFDFDDPLERLLTGSMVLLIF